MEGGHGSILLETQPPQSPDFNLCDLSFFWSLQKASVLQEGRHSDLESMQTAVIQAFKTYDPDALKYTSVIKSIQ